MVYRISCIIVYCICKLFFKVEVKGREVFPAKGPFLLASNHLSHIDPAALAAFSPRKVGFLAKEELYKNKLLGAYLLAAGVMPLKRGKSDIRALRQALAILKTGGLAIFPQGTRGAPMDQANAGVGFLCRKAKVPIIVAKFSGTDELLPKGAKFFKPGKMKIVFDKMTGINESDSSQEIAKKVMNKIKSL